MNNKLQILNNLGKSTYTTNNTNGNSIDNILNNHSQNEKHKKLKYN